MTPADLYLDLLKKCLTRYMYPETLKRVDLTTGSFWKRFVKQRFGGALSRRGMSIAKEIPFDPKKRELGRDWPHEAETMIGLKRLDNLQDCIRTIIADDVPGDLIETGVWRGGASIFMRAALMAFEDDRRTVWCADSFAGLPKPNVEMYPQDRGMTWHTSSALAVSEKEVIENFRRYGMLDERVKFLKGWFKDTLPTAPIDKLSLIRLDGDMYESTLDALNNLYSKLSPGGFLIIDDFGIPEDTCRNAIAAFRRENNISEKIVDIDGFGAFWRKGSS